MLCYLYYRHKNRNIEHFSYSFMPSTKEAAILTERQYCYTTYNTMKAHTYIYRSIQYANTYKSLSGRISSSQQRKKIVGFLGNYVEKQHNTILILCIIPVR